MFVCAECGASRPAEGRCAADGIPLLARGEDLLLGTTIGAYRVARLLGIGGMGRVYKGVHPTIGSRVAIKVLSRECSDRRDLVERFFSEAKAVNLIRHESIVNVLDLAMLPDGRPYIIMEYLDGVPLAAIVEGAAQRGIPVPLGGLARLAAEVLDALGAAHAKQIVHRDLKPDNIFVTPAGRPKVLDFGIAKLNDLGASATRTGSLLGTPHYMSPEQAAGRPVDLRADIYAMGVILFECATGQKPFTAESLFELLRQHVEAPPPSPRALRRDMPPDLESVILTALGKTADQRFASAQAMSMALQHATSQLPSEQWAPLTAASATSGGWAPTPPASWTGRSSQPPQPAMIGQVSTVSAGQVTAPSREPPKQKSGKGLWIGIAAIAIVVVGITAAVVAGGGGDGSGSAVALGSASGSDPVAKEPPPGTAPPADPKTTNSAKPVAARNDDDDADDVGKDEIKAAQEMLDEQLKNLPADVQKKLGGLKNFGKLSPGQRQQQLAEIQKQLAEAIDDPDAPGVAAPAIAQATKTPAAGAWVESHDLSSPPGYTAKRVDVAKFIPFAIAQAKKAVPDAVMYRIDVEGVSPDGFANLTLPTLASDHGSIDIRFISPAHATRDPNQPIGTPFKKECEFRIEATPTGVELGTMFASGCKEKALPIPRCGFAAMWKKAIAKGAPGGNAVANLGFRNDFSGRPTWYFDIGFGMDVAFSELFRDDC
jgi:serine/threonine protein kinase